MVAGRIFGDWAIPVIAAAAALKATGTLGGWMLVSGESGARAAQRGYLPAIFGRLMANGAAGWGLFIVALAMTVISFVTRAPTIAGQFGTIIGMVTLLIVLAYVAAGLSLLIGTPERRPGWRERGLGIGALLACALLIFSSGINMILGSLGITAGAWILFRVFARKP